MDIQGVFGRLSDSVMKKQKFLQTKEWRELRKTALERDCHRCFLCGSEEKLCVHHIRYRRFHKDLQAKLWNLITLCRKCHWLVHKSSANIDLAHKLKSERPEQFKTIIS